jgi:hypothetical protein
VDGDCSDIGVHKTPMKTIIASPLWNLSALALISLFVGTSIPSPADPPPPSATGALYSTDFALSPFTAPDTRWWVSNPALVTWVQDVIHGGKGSLKISNLDKTKGVSAYGPYVAYTGPALRLSVELKQDSLVTGVLNPTAKALVAIYYYDAEQHEINVPWPKYHDIQSLPDGSLDWQTYDKICTLPSSITGVAFARVGVFLPGTGTIWVDNITLVQGP